MSQAKPGHQRHQGNRLVGWVNRGGLTVLAFAAPAVILFATFSWWPILRGLMMAFQKINFVAAPQWVGLDNFQRVLADPLLGRALVNTLEFTGISILIAFPLPIILAVTMNELRKARQSAAVLIYLPVIIPPVASILLWKTFFNPSETGLFNTVLGWFGIPPQPWLQSPVTAMPSIVLEAVWAGIGTSTIIYMAALRSIRTELYEAAEIDGASILRRVWHVTLPELRGVMVIMGLLLVIGAVQVFTEPFIFTSGGPVNATTTLVLLLYRYAFIFGDFGKATALGVMIALGLSVITVVYLIATRRFSKE